jgi:chromosome segregation ATPase
MASETQAQAIGEMLSWVEQQVREAREEQVHTLDQLDQLRRQVHEFGEAQSVVERAVREVEPKLVPFRGLPEKLRTLDEAAEHLRQQLSANRVEVEHALRLLRAEAEHDRTERGEAIQRIERANSHLALVAADLSQLQAQTSQVSQAAGTLLERQREVEARVEQFGLRLDRTIEVHRDLEERIKQVVIAGIEERFEMVFERLQVVGEMVKRNEALIESVAAEQTLRTEVLAEIAVWREQHIRIDTRLNTLEELGDRMLSEVDKVQGEIALLEGRHSGLGERVSGIRRDISEVVDHVREEFAKYNQMMEKQRRKQIQVLEQELREMKFHAFRPPEEP